MVGGLIAIAVLVAAFQTPVAAEPSFTGQTGLINMPDARVEKDGTLRFGAGLFDPYLPIWSSITLLPRIELSGRYTIIRGLSGGLGKGFGDFKDKAFDVKALLLKEYDWLPAFALGSQDFTGTGVFSAKYGVLSKRLGGTDYTLGFGTDRIDGLFGGVRQQVPWIRNLSLVVEYDANDYENDFRADESGADSRDGGWTYGVEYKIGWLGAQLATDGDDVGINTWVSIPLEKKEFVPKIHEPAPYTKQVPQASIDLWVADTGYAARLARALYEREYKNIRLGFNGRTLSASLTNTRISQVGRAVGRAARIMLALGPVGTRAIRITYTEKGLPALTYFFSDSHKLQRYFDGLISRGQLDHYLEISYAEPGVVKALSSVSLDIPAGEEPALYEDIRRTDEGHFLSFRREGKNLSSFQVVPFNVSWFFNDPNGAARYDLYTTLNYTQQIGTGLFFDSGVKVTLDEDVSKVSQASNSRLHHVRSDIADYLKGGGRVKLTKLMVNQYFQPHKRVYARASAGIYELMFAGAGGQVLYLPERGNWATDLTVDWLRQRSSDDMFEFRDYDTVTALGALHYRLPSWGLTATVRAGRFLARDKGARIEIQRRFRSGITLGGWYTVTDGNDKTPPGSPGDPYFDKGIFASIPLGSMLTKDTRSRAELSIRPWTRDVGQMVVSPGDLYTLFERTLMLDNVEHGVGSRLGQ